MSGGSFDHNLAGITEGQGAKWDDTAHELVPADFAEFLHELLDVTGTASPVKGNLLVGDGTNWQVLPVGADGQRLTPESTDPLGLEWVDAASGGGGSLTIEDDGVVVATGVDTIDFKDNLTVTDLGAGEVAVNSSASGGGASSFLPDDLSDLAHWWDASQETGFTSGDPVDTATDFAGTQDLTQATASNQPTWQDAVVNSLAVFRFDGSDDFLAAALAADWQFLHDGSDWTAFWVAKTTTFNPNELGVVLGTSAVSASSKGTILGMDNRSTQSNRQTMYLTVSNGSSFINRTPQQDGTWNTAGWVIGITRHQQEGGAGPWTRWSGGLNHQPMSRSAAYPTGDPAGALRMGASTGTTFPYDGDIGMAGFYTRALTGDEIRGLFRGLASTYGLTLDG